MDRANFGRAALSAGAGAVGAILLYAFLHVFGPIELEGGNLMNTSPEENRHLWIRLLTTQLLPYLAVLGISGALVARAFGMTWQRAIVSSLVAYAAATAVATVVSLALDLLVTVRETQFGSLILVFTTSVVLLLALRRAPTMLLVVAAFIAAVTFSCWLRCSVATWAWCRGSYCRP